MKNTIYIGKNASGRYVKTEDGSIPHYSSDVINEFLNFLGVDLHACGIQLIHDTETGLTKIKKERKTAWYLTKHKSANIVIARYWDGKKWDDRPEYVYSINDESYFIIDETPISSPLLLNLK